MFLPTLPKASRGSAGYSGTVSTSSVGPDPETALSPTGTPPGQGGPSLWVARETGADLVGVDLSSAGIVRASARVAEFGLTGRARFQVADLVATGQEDASFDGAMSVDALWAVPDKPAALRGMA